jgi:hypothetical protein
MRLEGMKPSTRGARAIALRFSLLLAAGLAKSGHTVSRSCPATREAFDSALAAYEARTSGRDLSILYLVVRSFLGLLGEFGADPLAPLRALGRRIDEATAGRISSRIYGTALVEDRAGVPGLWGLSLRDDEGKACSALGLEASIAGPKARDDPDGLGWRPQSGREPARLSLPWRGFFDREEAQSYAVEGSQGTETRSELRLHFLDGKLGRVELSAASDGTGSSCRVDSLIRHEAIVRYLGLRLPGYKLAAEKPMAYKSNVAEASAGGKTYIEMATKYSLVDSFLGSGLRISVSTSLKDTRAGDSESVETYAEQALGLTLENDDAEGWKD